MLPKRFLGNTGLELSLIGLGTVKFGRNTQVKYPQHFEIPSVDSFIQILQLAQQLGINVLDTAGSYGDAETKLGNIFQDSSNDIQRADWIVMTKAGEEFNNDQSDYNFTAKYIDASITKSVKQLKTDYIDILLVHSDGSDQQISQDDKLWQVLEHRKQQGDLKAFGVSSKTLDGGLACLQRADLAMITYRADYLDEAPLIDYALAHNKGIVIKKVFNSGHNPVAEALAFASRPPSVTSMIIGTINPQHLISNVAALTD